MALQTSNFGLIKPELTDAADITAFNENWDKIDEQLLKASESGGSDLVQTEYDGNVSGDPPEIEPVVQTELNKLNKLNERPINNNILINSNFANPVNQRGETSKDTMGYWIDRWKKDGFSTNSIKDGYIEINGGTSSTSSKNSLVQYIEHSKFLLGKTVTFSVKERNGNVSYLTTQIPSSFPTTNTILVTEDFGDLILKIETTSTGFVRVIIGVEVGKTIQLAWAKFEIGENATPYISRLYAEEWLLCQRYYQKHNMLPMCVRYISITGKQFVVSASFIEMRITPSYKFTNLSLLDDSGDAIDVTYEQHVIDSERITLWVASDTTCNRCFCLHANELELDAEI